MNGQLTEHPLAELISEIAAKNLSGALRVMRDRVKAAIYFEAGTVIYATANLRNYRLAEYLLKHGVTTPEQIARTRDPSSDFALAAALQANGMVSRAALDLTLNEQVADVLRLVLLWPDGQWEFDPRARLNEPTGVKVPIRQLLIESVRRMELQFASSRFSDFKEVVRPVGDAPTELSLSSAEGFVLSRIEGPITLAELVALSGQPEPDSLRTIYALVLGGFLQRERWPDTFKNEVPRTVKPGTPASSKEMPTKVQPPKPEAKEDLSEFLDRLGEATNHYEVLGVSAMAEIGEIRNAYHSLARRFHPDRFHDLAGTPLHARLESAFARITQANETLANRDGRANYDAKVAALKATRPGAKTRWDTNDDRAAGIARGTENQVAEREFQKGVAAFREAHFETAISSLSEAARLAPHQARYRAYYGRALASQQKTRRLAEVELQAAIKLDAGNGSYRVMLAALYRDLGFSRRAMAELERALALDSQNAEAREMLKTLQSKKL